MKELSIEEKAKRYDEALEKARQLCAYPTTKPFISDLKDLFPELLESEDEKIRSALIRGFNSMYANQAVPTFAGEPIKDILAWLEKQGEKSVDKLQVSGELYEHIRSTCACIDDALSSKTLADINDYLSMANRSAQSAFDMIEKQDKKRANGNEREIPNSSWSEEDERNLDWLITVCERIHYKSDPQVSPESALILREWLKSLRPQSQWKPSNEQMGALEYYMHTLVCNEHKEILFGLYADLKKLREE